MLFGTIDRRDCDELSVVVVGPRFGVVANITTDLALHVLGDCVEANGSPVSNNRVDLIITHAALTARLFG